jgi:hypothetical protein
MEWHSDGSGGRWTRFAVNEGGERLSRPLICCWLPWLPPMPACVWAGIGWQEAWEPATAVRIGADA